MFAHTEAAQVIADEARGGHEFGPAALPLLLREARRAQLGELVSDPERLRHWLANLGPAGRVAAGRLEGPADRDRLLKVALWALLRGVVAAQVIAASRTALTSPACVADVLATVVGVAHPKAAIETDVLGKGRLHRGPWVALLRLNADGCGQAHLREEALDRILARTAGLDGLYAIKLLLFAAERAWFHHLVGDDARIITVRGGWSEIARVVAPRKQGAITQIRETAYAIDCLKMKVGDEINALLTVYRDARHHLELVVGPVLQPTFAAEARGRAQGLRFLVPVPTVDRLPAAILGPRCQAPELRGFLLVLRHFRLHADELVEHGAVTFEPEDRARIADEAGLSRRSTASVFDGWTASGGPLVARGRHTLDLGADYAIERSAIVEGGRQTLDGRRRRARRKYPNRPTTVPRSTRRGTPMKRAPHGNAGARESAPPTEGDA